MSNFLIPDWPAPSSVKAAATTRSGGIGSKPYDTLNLGLHVGDDPEVVERNRQILTSELQLPQTPQWLNQVHGTEVYRPAGNDGDVPTADAAWTDQPGCVLAVMTADCLPVLLTSKSGECVAVIHGGWRGLLAGIIRRTVSAMPVAPEGLLAWLGPAIGPQAFEVGAEVRDAFMHTDQQFGHCFVSREEPGKYLADIFEIGRLCLQDAGVSNVSGGERCTYQEPGHFFSHRRDAGQTGRMASLIWIEQD